jgi:hypothetical protein
VTLLDTARQFLFVRERGGQNRGKWVEIFQRFTGNAPGDSWCASFVSFVLAISFAGSSPLLASASCAEILADARAKGLVTDTPIAGETLFFFVDHTGHAHHVGFVTENGGLAGNTSSDGLSSNGDGVYEHALNVVASSIVYVSVARG